MIPRLADERTSPIVGRYYMVPYVRAKWHGVLDDWPVVGPLHEDAKHFNFDLLHYHIDARFLNARQLRETSCDFNNWKMLFGCPVTFGAAYGYPENKIAPKGRPLEKRMRCAREYPDASLIFHNDPPSHNKMIEDYGNPATAIHRKDGRMLCPHRKFDLSTITPDDIGLTTCPLHGLRVDCSKAKGL